MEVESSRSVEKKILEKALKGPENMLVMFGGLLPPAMIRTASVLQF
jgi:hypothetical protein